MEVLTGIRMEVTESSEIALSFYDELLATDSSNAVCSSFTTVILATQAVVV